MVQDSQWYSEYQRVCLLNLSQPLPTIPFNISITTPPSNGAGPTTTVVISASSAMSSTSTASGTTGIRISPDGTCGESYGYTCKGSSFGDCCSIYGYWYSIPIFTTFYSQDSDSNYQYTVVLVVTTAVLIVIRSMGTAVRIVHHLRLRLVLLRHCHQLQLHQLQQLQFLRMVHAERLMDILAKGQPSGTVVAYMVIGIFSHPRFLFVYHAILMYSQRFHQRLLWLKL